MAKYLTYTAEIEAQTALDAINATFGFPDNNGTDTWDVIEKAYNTDVWFFTCPPDYVAENTMADISAYRKPNNLDLL